MPYKETGKEKEKREAYYKANKEKGIRAEKQREYEMFGTTEQNIPNVNPMGDVVTPAAGMKKGGSVKAPSMRHEYSAPSKSTASKRADGIAQRGKTKGKIV